MLKNLVLYKNLILIYIIHLGHVRCWRAIEELWCLLHKEKFWREQALLGNRQE